MLVRRVPGPVISHPPPASDGGPAHGPVFDEMYQAHFSFVWRNARRLGTPDADMDDVLQEIFVVAFRRLAEFEGRSSLKTWLLGIVINIVRAHRRTLSAKHPHALRADRREEPDAVADAADGPHECATRSEAARLVEQLLAALDDRRREVFVLVELEQMTVPEIATALAVPLNTVYSRLRKARQEFGRAAARHRAKEQARDDGRKR